MTLLASEKATATVYETYAPDVAVGPATGEQITRHESLSEIIVGQLDELLDDTYRGRRGGFTQHVGSTTHEFDMCAMRTEGGGPIEELVTRHQKYLTDYSRTQTQYEVEIFSQGIVRLRINLLADGTTALHEYDEQGKQSVVLDTNTEEMALFELAHRISDSRSRVEHRTGLERTAADADATLKLVAAVPRLAWRGPRTE